MLNKNDFKYILKRVIVFLIIALLVAFLGSCNAKANVITPDYANLQYNVNNQTNYINNPNPTQYTFSTEYNGASEMYYSLVQSNRNIGEITHVNVGFNSPLATTPSYSTFKFAMLFNGFNYYQHPWLDIQGVYTYDNQTHNYTPCDIEGGYINITNYAYVSNIRCYTQERIDQISFQLKCYDQDYCSAYPVITFGLEQFGYFTTDMTDAETIQAINDIQKEMSDNILWQQQTELNQQTYNSWFTSNQNQQISNNVIAQLVTLPITFLQAFLTGFNGTCQSYDLGTLFNTHLILPCINLKSYLGQSLFTIIDVICSGMMIFVIAKKMVNIFDDLTNLRTNQIDELYGGGA